ncbi:MAG: sodium:calcium antiporter [Candidatus Omnitrophica bacterium]|nr:sodium:calcium antiporter [Candidatus Omnitrophota bacterium]
MFLEILLLLLGLGTILLASEIFTNGLEVMAKRFSFSQAVVGSVLAAVGTALPETILPAVAIFITKGATSKDIGVGAILGAPFMISTLAFFLVGATAFFCSLAKRRKFEINLEINSVRRDIVFFLCMYSTAVFLPVFFGRSLNIVIALLLIIGYIVYVLLTIKGESAAVEHLEGLHFFTIQKRLGLANSDIPNTLLIFFQIAGSLVIMVFGAHIFVHYLEKLSLELGMNPLLFALILAPIATELPEKFNSVSWTIKGKDPLAVGNLTGAMVFQSTFPVSIGLIFTDWNLTPMAIFSAVLALISGGLILISITLKKRVSPFVFLAGGALYLTYIAALVMIHR